MALLGAQYVDLLEKGCKPSDTTTYHSGSIGLVRREIALWSRKGVWLRCSHHGRRRKMAYQLRMGFEQGQAWKVKEDGLDCRLTQSG